MLRVAQKPPILTAVFGVSLNNVGRRGTSERHLFLPFGDEAIHPNKEDDTPEIAVYRKANARALAFFDRFDELALARSNVTGLSLKREI